MHRLGAAAFLVALWVAPAVAQAPPRNVSFSVEKLEDYTPYEVSPGAAGTHPLAMADVPDIAPAALAEAQAYSDKLGGFALVVWHRGRLQYERYAPGLNGDTRFETFSMHKSILGLVYGAALLDGIVGSLDDRAGLYIDEWREDPRGAITIRQLLTMESGLRPPARGEAGAVQIAMGDQVTRAALEEPLEHPPGSAFNYNAGDSQVAGAILNRRLKARGQGDYAGYVSKVLLQKLGTGDAHLWLEHEGGDPRFFAHFQMAALDWLRVGIMIAHKGSFDGQQVLPPNWIEAMTAPSSRNPNYGMQVWLGSPWVRQRSYGPGIPLTVSHERPYLADDLVFFDGFGGERVYVSPSRDLVIVRIGKVHLDFDDSIIPNAILAGEARANP